MGEAYLAEGPNTWLVVKTVRLGAGDTGELAARMRHEVEAMRLVNSPLVAAIIADDLDAERPWFALEFVPGLSLAQRVTQFGPVPPAELPALGLGLARCIEAVHAADVVHRDLKPDNVILDSTGPRLIDFGTAEVAGATNLTAVGNVVGTMLWMAPEQVSGGETTAAADVHAWGLLMVYAATGIAAFSADSSVATMYRALNFTPPIPPVLGEPLGGLVARALAKEPGRRPRAGELVRDLSEAMGMAPLPPGAGPGAPGLSPFPLPGQQGRGPGPTSAPPWAATTDPTPQQPGYPAQPGYPQPGYQQPQQQGYPQAPGYPAQPAGYPQQQAGYPQQPGYPQQGSPTPPGGYPIAGGTPPGGYPPPQGPPTPPGGYPIPGPAPMGYPAPGSTPPGGYPTSAPTQPGGYPGGTTPPGGYQYGMPQPAATPAPKRKGHRGLVAALTVIPLLLVAGFGAWWLLIRDDGDGGGGSGDASGKPAEVVASSNHPVKISMTDGLKGQNVVRLSVGDSSACVVADNGRAYCWGSNSDGQLGSAGEGSNEPRAVDVSGVLKDAFLVRLSSGGRHVCTLGDNGQAYCWGANDKGQLGTGSTGEKSDVPVAVDVSGVLAGKRLSKIGATGDTTCASDDEGQMYCWGDNSKGQFGDGTTNDSAQAVAVDSSTGLSNVKAFSVGDDHTCAVIKGGTAFCWGANDRGQLGNGTTQPFLVPQSVQVPEDPTFSFGSVSAGGSGTCSYGGGGVVKCWGSGEAGQLGTGSTLDTPNPTTVVFGPNQNFNGAHAINHGGDTVCTVDEAGNGFCWGAGQSGELGNGKSENSLTPVALEAKKGKTLPPFIHVGVGDKTACAIGEDGSGWCWGSNENGQLGAGLAN